MRALAILGLLALSLRSATAITVGATIDPPRFAVGESADLAVTVEGTQHASVPQIGDTGGLTVSYVGPTSRMSIVNGRMSASVSHHYTVVGRKAGRYAIGPITVEADGRRYDAGTVTVEVVPAAAAGGGGAPAGEQLTLELALPHTQVYVRERLPLGVKLLVGAVRVADVQYPQVPGDGFALDKFPEPTQRREATARGVVQVVDFRTTLTPLRAGTVVVGPATMRLALVVPSRRSRGFFGGMFEQTQPFDLRSEPVTLTVLPLPSEGRPTEFSGAVGQFTFEVAAAPTELAAGDPVTVRSVVRGEGSLDGVAAPAIAGTEGLRVYPPQATTAGPETAVRTFEQVVIPLGDGTVELPAPRFAYFDPAARAYRTITPAPIVLTVRPSATAQVAPEIVGARPAAPAEPASRPETLGRDIVFIKDAPGRLRPAGSRLHRSPTWWCVQVVPVTVWVTVATIVRRRRRMAGDPRYARFTRAGREARRALAAARDALGRGDVTGGHDVLARAMCDYLAAKLDLAPGTVAETAPARLRASTVDGAVADRVGALFAGLEALRFAPGGASRSDLERALGDAERIVREIERTRRIAPAHAATVLALLGVATVALAAGGDGPSALFIRANGLYGEERYAEAAATYAQILAGGIESGPVLFNLGNAHLKAGDVGHAVAAYERAWRLIPGDPDLTANLAFARELAHDVAAPSLAERLLVPLASRAATDTLVVGTAVAWWIVWLALAAGTAVPRLRAVARAVVVASGLVGVAVGASAAHRWWTVERPTRAVVVAPDEVMVRSEPSPNATALFAAKPGTVVTVERTREASALVTSRDGRRGWLESTALELL